MDDLLQGINECRIDDIIKITFRNFNYVVKDLRHQIKELQI